jgi:RHS repeat-associated protein
LVTDTYDYTAFGEELAHTGTTVNPFRYVGESFDPNAGFYYLRARWYSPENGRFTSVDPYWDYEAQTCKECIAEKELFNNCPECKEFYDQNKCPECQKQDWGRREKSSAIGFHGKPQFTSHRYVYSDVNPINCSDPSGKISSVAELNQVVLVVGILATVAIASYHAQRNNETILVESDRPRYWDPADFPSGTRIDCFDFYYKLKAKCPKKPFVIKYICDKTAFALFLICLFGKTSIPH